MEHEELETAPKDWREYLANTRESFRTCRWVWHEFLAKEAKRWARRMVRLLFVSTLLGMIQPWLTSYILDGLIEHRGRLVVASILAMLGIMLGQRITDHFLMKAREWVLGYNIGQLDRRTSELFFEKSVGQHIQESTNLNLGNVEKGRGAILQLGNTLLFEGIPTLFQLAISFLLIWVISPVAASVMTFLLASYLIFAIFVNQRVLEVCTPLDAEFRKLNRHRVERWDKVERVKTCAKEKEEVNHMSEWFDDVIRKDRAFWFWVINVIFFRGALKTASVIVVIAYGAWRVWEGDWTIGMLYPLYVWSSHVSDNIWRISQIEHQLNWNLPAVRSMIKALTLTPDIGDLEGALALASEEKIRVEFQSVSYAYPKAQLEKTEGEHSPLSVLSNVSFDIAPDEKVALIGPSGAGKTTVMHLLQRHMDPTGGVILINGTDLRDVRLDSWTSLLGYIPQQSMVFDGTIRYNLLYGLSPEGQRGISDEELWRIMKRLQIDFGERLVNGLETVVGRNGVKLSGGQAQRLMIGAAVLRRPRLMVIDEATSSLDSTTERAVQEGLREVLKNGTSALIVTHRLSTVRHLCNKFVVLRGAETIKNGDPQVEAIAPSFEELYHSSPTFRQLSDDQGVTVNAL